MATPDRPTAVVSSQAVPVAIFLIIAFGLPWLIRPFVGLGVVQFCGMLAVGLATFVALRWPTRQPNILRETGITPIRPIAPLLRWCALAMGLIIGLAVLAILLGVATGVTRLDLVEFSGLHAAYGTEPGQDTPEVLAYALAQSFLLFLAVLPLAFCEEWGWRGFLLPRLLRFGTWPALLLSGLIWAVWHLPGYVGADASSGFLPFLLFVLGFGILLAWIRMASGSIWPVTVAHAANNALVTGVVNVGFVDAGHIEDPNPWNFALLGWPGWVCFGLLTVYLTLSGRLTRSVRDYGAAIR